jgi:hypothetical protein
MNAKHFYILSSALLLSTVCQAQIVKGDKLLGGSIGFTRGNSNNFNGAVSADNSLTAINLGLSYGKAVKNNTVNGFNAGFTFINNPVSTFDPATGANIYNNKIRSGTVGVFRRRYIPLGKNFYAFGQLGADFAYTQNEYTQFNSGVISEKVVNKSYVVNASLYPGFSYQLNNRFMLDLTLGSLVNIGYANNTRRVNSQPATPSTNTFYLNSNLSLSSLGNISVGFRVLFHNKKSDKKSAG